MMLLNLKGVSQQLDLDLNQKSLRSNPTMFATSNQIPPKCRKYQYSNGLSWNPLLAAGIKHSLSLVSMTLQPSLAIYFHSVEAYGLRIAVEGLTHRERLCKWFLWP